MRHMFRAALSLLVFVLAISSPIAARASVTVNITVDNAYAFGFGDVNGVPSLTGVENCTAGQIYNCGGGPEQYNIGNVNLATTYIYIAAWSDDQTKQGVLASFTDGTITVDSGLLNNGVGPQWEVYSTGEPMDISSGCTGDGCAPLSPPGPPTVAGMNGHIATANSGGLWQNSASGFLAFGDHNDGTGTTFPGQTCPSIIHSSAQWMWRNPDPLTITNPFTINGNMTCGASQSQEYLIFRVGPIGPILHPDLFNAGKAKQYKTWMVRAFTGCDEPGGPVDNTTINGSLPACAPPVPLSPYSYQDCTGWCRVQIDRSPQLESCDCKIKARCRGILDPTLALITGNSGFRLDMLWRETTATATGISVPFSIPFPLTVIAGHLDLDTTCDALWSGLGFIPMPPASSVEIQDVVISDPDGKRFAVPGFNCCPK